MSQSHYHSNLPPGCTIDDLDPQPGGAGSRSHEAPSTEWLQPRSRSRHFSPLTRLDYLAAAARAQCSADIYRRGAASSENPVYRASALRSAAEWDRIAEEATWDAAAAAARLGAGR